MLSNLLKAQILDYLQNGHCEAEAVRFFGVSRNTVRNLIKISQILKTTATTESALQYLLKIDNSNNPIEKCPTCGKLVHLPCRECLLKQYIKITQQSNDEILPPITENEIRLELKPQHEERYQEIRKWRDKKSIDKKFKPPYIIPKNVSEEELEEE